MANIACISVPLEPAHEAISSELYRQGAYWAACALSDKDTPESLDSGPGWHALDSGLFAPPEAGVATADALRELASSGSFSYFAELSALEQLRARLSLHHLADRLVARFDERDSKFRSLRAQRWWRLLLFMALLLAGALGVTWRLGARREQSELAAGKEWRISSNYGIGGCSSPEQLCSQNTGYFFHTDVNDRSPWIEFDLRAVQQISAVEVENRRDCCFDRAVPLVLEVSTDHKHWHAVARREAVFSTWSASFHAHEARWVRLRVLKSSALHLYSIRIYP